MRNLIPERIIENLKHEKFQDEFKCFSIFVDISGFTSTTEALMKHGQEGAEVLSDILRYLFDTTVKAVYEHGGYVTKYAGDAFTALFEPGKDYRQTAVNVLNTALITNRFFAENKIFRSKFGDFEFGVKVGMGFGDCICGIAGSDNEKSYYFSGSAVDLCAMAEHNADKGDIWMSESAYSYISDLLIKPGKDKLYGKNFYKVIKTLEFDSKSSTYKRDVYEKDLIYALAGKPESEFPVGEFRDVISVFISFEGEVDLNKLMKYLYELKKTYGSSHPVIDFGDKGGNILLFFGAPISYENNSFRALSLILKLVEYAGNDFKIRAGLAKGVVYCGFNGSELRNEFTCLGNTVNQSARFMMKAEWGQVLIDKELASGENFITEHLADLQYKGREGLIPTYILKSKAEIKDIFFKGSFVGREKELARLQKYLEPLERGKNCGVIYVDGEAGIGKSRLTNEIRREHEKKKNEQPVKWFYFVCDDIIKDPFNALRYFFTRYFHLKDENSTEANTRTFKKNLNFDLKEYTDYLAYFLDLNVSNSNILVQDPVERQNNVILAFIEFFKTANENHSIVYEIDNAAYIDEYSANFFLRISAYLKKYPSAFIFNCRYKDNGEVYDLKLKKQKRLKLKGLKSPEFKDLVKDRLARDKVPSSTFRVIEDKTSRNPFFTEQIIHFLKDNRMLDEKFRIVPDKEIPTGLDQIVIARVDKLSKDLKEILKTCSVLGNEIQIDIISELLKGKFKNYRRNLNELASEDILILFTEMSYLFKISVMRDAVYHMQLKKTLRQIHNLTGLTIEKLHKDGLEKYYSVLAFHFDNAENSEKATEYHTKAGIRSKRNNQNSQALSHFDRAAMLMTISEGIDEGCWINLDPAVHKDKIEKYIAVNFERFHFYFALHQNINKSTEIIEQISRLSDLISDNFFYANALIDKSLLLTNEGKYKESNILLEKSIRIYEDLGEFKKIPLAYMSLGKNYLMSGDLQKAGEQHELSLRYAEMIDNEFEREKVMVKLYGDMGIVHDYGGDFKKAVEFYSKQLSLAEKLNMKIDKSLAVQNLGVVYHITGDLDKAKEYYEMKLKLSEELGRKPDIAQILNNMGFLYKDLENPKKAVQYHKKSFTLSKDISDYNTMASASINLGHAYKMLKEFTKAEKEFKSGIEISERYSYKNLMAEAKIELGELYMITGNDDFCEKFIHEGLETAKEIGLTEYIEKGELLKKKIKK